MRKTLMRVLLLVPLSGCTDAREESTWTFAPTEPTQGVADADDAPAEGPADVPVESDADAATPDGHAPAEQRKGVQMGQSEPKALRQAWRTPPRMGELMLPGTSRTSSHTSPISPSGHSGAAAASGATAKVVRNAKASIRVTDLEFINVRWPPQA